MSKYEYLIVGAGLFGATIAYKLINEGHTVLVMDKNDHVGGTCHTELKDNIYIHSHGPHIFHTNKRDIWNFVNMFDEFEQFQYQPLAYYKDTYYNLPFNMHTLYQIYGVQNIEDAKNIIGTTGQYSNVEEMGISVLGADMYEVLVKGYTEKQWGMRCTQITPNILSRLPVRLEWDNNYFNDEYQGIPKHGYTTVIENMLKTSYFNDNGDVYRIELLLGEKFDISKHYELAENIIYTGSIDELCDYIYGILPYRSLEFSTVYNEPTQGIPVINFTDKDIPYTRCIDHKMFLRSTKKLPNTIKTYETPKEFSLGMNRYYPIPLNINIDLYNKYKKYVEKKYPKIMLGGRLGSYKYMNMDEIIEQALNFKL